MIVPNESLTLTTDFLIERGLITLLVLLISVVVYWKKRTVPNASVRSLESSSLKSFKQSLSFSELSTR